MHQRVFHRLRPLVILLCLGAISFSAHAQSGEEQLDLDQIEAEIGKSAPAPEAAPAQGEATSTLPDPQNLSDLSKLAPFSEVSVIQRRYMPKTDRFQFYLGLGGIMNDPWFYGLGATGKLGYHFTEDWGIEGTYMFLSNSERDSVKDLKSNNGVTTSSLVTTKGYLGVDVIWSPIYGKMSLYNKRIIPFDMYFTAGIGQSSIDGSTTSSASTMHIGTGQIYALNKSWGFRWDFTWNMFSAEQKGTSTQFNNLILTLGGSFFFPEAKYR